MSNIDLSPSELRMLVESLEHCIATCQSEDKSSSGLCSDCEAAKALREKLAAQLPA